MRDHPMIESIMRTGYPQNMAEQPECAGIDFYDCEILAGDDVCEFDGELILQDNLERFLVEQLGFAFKTAE